MCASTRLVSAKQSACREVGVEVKLQELERPQITSTVSSNPQPLIDHAECGPPYRPYLFDYMVFTAWCELKLHGMSYY